MVGRCRKYSLWAWKSKEKKNNFSICCVEEEWMQKKNTKKKRENGWVWVKEERRKGMGKKKDQIQLRDNLGIIKSI